MSDDARTDVLASSDADELPVLSKEKQDKQFSALVSKHEQMKRDGRYVAPKPAIPQFAAPLGIETGSVVPIRRTSQISAKPHMTRNQCFECVRRGRNPVVMLANPGICFECGMANRSDAATSRLALANGSIHAERKWARLDSDLLSERIDPLSWSMSVGGKMQTDGHDLASLRAEMVTLTAAPRLVIYGKETGVGKTSFAVALMHSVIDAAHADMCRDGVEPNPHGEGARMIAAIDLLDPNVCKVANAAPFVLLDDAGQEGRATGFRAAEALMVTGNMLDRRERTPRKRTIITTYGNRDQWGQWYGGRVVRLYWDMPSSVVIEMRSDR